MDFKQALVAHLQGEFVQLRRTRLNPWEPMTDENAAHMLQPDGMLRADDWQFRIKPRTVMCNGVEVPAPESVAPAMHMRYLVPCTASPSGYAIFEWKNNDQDKWLLENGLVHYDMDACIARSKAMLITC